MIAAYKNISSEELISTINSLKKENEEKDFRIAKLETELAQLRRLIFGSKSERFVPSVPPEQTALALNVGQTAPAPAEKETITYERNTVAC